MGKDHRDRGEIERKLENYIIMICSSATISNFGPVLEFYK